MRERTVAFLLLLVACSLERPLPLSDASTCSGVCGRVVDGSGKPVTRFTVRIFSAAPGSRFGVVVRLPAGYPANPGPLVRTAEIRSSDGWFDVDPHGAMRVVVGISAAGYRSHQTAPFEPAANRPALVTLVPSHRIRVRVRDENSRPVAGAKIYYDIESRPLAESLRTAAESKPLARTNSDGAVFLDEPVLPRASVLIVGERHVPTRVTFARGSPAVEAVLHEGVVLRGTVREASGSFLAGAAIEARCDGWPPFQTLARTDGSFVFERLPRVVCGIVAARDLVNDDDLHAVVLDPIRGSATADLRGGAARAEVVIPPSGRISGRLTGLDRHADGYAAFARRGAEIVPLVVRSDGNFARRLSPGVWDLYGTFDTAATHLETAHASVQVADGQESRADLPFPNATTIRISVHEWPPSSTELTLEPHDPAIRTRARIVTSTAGVWQISGLDRGTYTASLKQGEWKIAGEIEVPSKSNIDVPLYTAELYVHDAAGSPLDADVRILQSIPAVEGVSITRVGEMAQRLGAAGNGRHVQWETPPGTYVVSIRAAGYKDTTDTLILPGQAPRVVLQTIDRPYGRLPSPPMLEASKLAVLRAVIADLNVRAREIRRARGEAGRGRLVVADQTVAHPSTITMWVDSEREAKYARLKWLKERPLFHTFDRDQSVHTLPHQIVPGVLTVPFGIVPVRPPREWNHMTSEAELFDPRGIAERWDKATAFVLLSSPQLSPDDTEALMTVALFTGDFPATRLYWLVQRNGGWVVKESWDVDTAPGC